MTGRLSPAVVPSGVFRAIMDNVAYCDRCEMDREYCEHGLAERRRTASASASNLRISPSNMAHFPACPHKGDDPDYSRWAELDTPRAWERLGNGEELRATDGRDLVAKPDAGTVSTTVRGKTRPAVSAWSVQTVGKHDPARSAA
jgi:hypothetical protein